jgi:hypothetical protein
MGAAMLFKECSRPNYQNERNLIAYGANYWVPHFVEIDLDKVSDADVVRVVNLLYKILNNHNNTARTHEYFSTQLYSEMIPQSDVSWLDIVAKWAKRAATLDSRTMLSSDVQAWVMEFSASQAMMTLAHGHVANWYQERFGDAILESFRFAKDALGFVSFPCKI